ncbi:MAG: riboflavin synthase [Deltaproteobacteria bacterium]|jgi:riboflavin synthase|nr:riboflavin synthase [Deltaproteobacteria bacterium]
MFTGLTLGQGLIEARTPAPGGLALTIRPDFAWEEPLSLGESVAVSGVCLTVETLNPPAFTSFASQETLARSTLGVVTRVNLERALKLSDRLGGHLVSGHVEGRGRLTRARPLGRGLELEFYLPQELAALTVAKGSIAVDGVSLTVSLVGPNSFTVNLIPATLARTTLAELTPGQEVNLETDLLAKYVQKLLNKSGPTEGLTLEKLAAAGFL